MGSRRLLGLLKWIAAAGLLAAVFAGAYWANHAMRAERDREEAAETIQSPRRSRDGIVALGVEAAQRYGLDEARSRAVSWSERVTVYGQVVPNPKATAELRAPLAGSLRAAREVAWPAPGQWVRTGQLLGWLDVRITAQERLTLEENLNTARIKKEGAEKVVRLQRDRVKRVEAVSRSQIVPGQQLDDAKVLLAEAETQLAIAAAGVALWQKALEEVERPGERATSTYSQPLHAPGDGEVTELAARPGMAVEAGALVAQVVDFRRPLVRLDMPPESGPPARLRLHAIAAEPSVEAALVGPAPRVDAASQTAGYWYAVEPEPAATTAAEPDPHVRGPGPVWRPGLLVKATVPSGTSRPAVAVPADAVLFHQGRPLVYVRAKPGAYERREVRLLGREGPDWVLAPPDASGLVGVNPDEPVVSRGAHVLLSEEFRSAVVVE